MQTPFRWVTCLMIVVSQIIFSGCGSDGNDSPGSAEPKLLVINEGALNASPGATQKLTATLIGPSGKTDVTADVEWSENSEEGSFSSNTLSVGSAASPFIVTASYTEDSKTYTAQVPVNVLMPSSPLIVAPAGILVYQGNPSMQLNTFFLGKGDVTGYQFSSTNSSIAAVDANGLVTFNSAGQCEISVSSKGITPQQTVVVPVLVVGALAADLEVIPVTKITLTPSSKILFLGEKTTLEAHAYNSKGEEVTPDDGFTWTMESLDVDTEDEEEAEPTGAIAPNNNKCEFNANASYGRAKVTVTASGVSANAEVFVSPEFVMFINPPMVGIATGASRQFEIETYPVDKETMSLDETAVANPAGVKWNMLDFGFEEFSIGNVDANGNVTIKQEANDRPADGICR